MKTKATMKQIEKVLSRAVTVPRSPEVNLWFAVLISAIVAATTHKHERDFVFHGTGFALICDVLGLNATWVRELINDHYFKHPKKPVIDLDQVSENSFP